MKVSLAIAFLVECLHAEPAFHTRQWAVQLDNPEQAENISVEFNLLNYGHVVDSFYLFEAAIYHEPLHSSSIIKRNWNGIELEKLDKKTPGDIESLFRGQDYNFQAQIPLYRYKRRVIKSRASDITYFSDPLFKKQWHLYNNGDNGNVKGSDINVLPVWKRGINGTGTTVSIIDDGVDFSHPDFQDAWSKESSYDFTTNKPDPAPADEHDTHGTRCAGEVGARPNSVCGVGVAFGAKLAGERLIATTTMDATEAKAFLFKNQINDIYSASWGPSDDGTAVDGPGSLGKRALIEAVTSGRNGRGSIFVFASGNGGKDQDNCNYDGYANSIYTISVGAITASGKKPWYGEECAAHLAVVYSGGEGLGISTTDVQGKCTDKHSGTSAAAPLASGIVALMLSVRPELGWRDVQQLIVSTAQPTDEKDMDWIKNGAGKLVSHKYGFGKMDATRLVDAAVKHTIMPSPALKFAKLQYPNVVMAYNTPKDFKIDMQIHSEEVGKIGLVSLEHVQVTVKIRHPERGHLKITLVSPSGTPSIIGATRPQDESADGYSPWTFMTVRNWGESPSGTWSLRIEDARLGGEDANGKPFAPGVLESWEVVLYGVCTGEDIMEAIDQETGRVSRKCIHTVKAAEQIQREIMIGLVCFLIGVVIGIAIYVFKKVRENSGRKFTLLGSNDPDDRTDVESPALSTAQERIALMNLKYAAETRKAVQPKKNPEPTPQYSDSEYSSEEESEKHLLKMAPRKQQSQLEKAKSLTNLIDSPVLRRTNSASKPLNLMMADSNVTDSPSLKRANSAVKSINSLLNDKKLEKTKNELKKSNSSLMDLRKTMTRSQSFKHE